MKYIWLTSMLALAACQTPSTPVQRSVAAPASYGSIMSILNAERAAQGRPPLREDRRLSRASQAHARDMVVNSFFSHIGSNGSDLSDRARAAGYNCVAAENIATGQKTEVAVMEAWIASPGHRRNINLSDVTDYGIGRDGTMWVMLFGRGC